MNVHFRVSISSISPLEHYSASYNRWLQAVFGVGGDDLADECEIEAGPPSIYEAKLEEAEGVIYLNILIEVII